MPAEDPRPPTPDGQRFERIDLANAVVSVSADLRENQPIARAFDGCLAARDACAVATGRAASLSVVFDLGRPHALGGARLFGNTRHDWISRTWSLRIREHPDEPWRRVIGSENAFVEGWRFARIDGATAQFLELTVTGDDGHGVEFNEFEVLGRPVQP